jgi:hypothetical protein
MKRTNMCTLLAFLSVSTWQAGAQFVDVTAEISSIQWRSTKAISEVSTVQCVVGLNSWQIKSETSQYPKSTYFYWFTGKRFIERSSSFPIEAIPDGPPPTWLERTNIVASDDGNPSGPRKFEDLMGGDERAAWLAFCSGQYLQREGREIFPPVFSWKFEIWPSFAPDRTDIFEDARGLPKRVDLATTNGQPVFLYRVSKSTNMLGWEFPLEFHVVQYRPQYALRFEAPYYNTNAWVVDWTAIGRVTHLGVGTRPKIPPELLIAAGELKPDEGNNRTQRTPR